MKTKTYKELNEKKRERAVKRLPRTGTWLPISIVAFLLKCSKQKLRLMYLHGQVDGIKFPAGPMLIDLEEAKRADG